MEQQRVSPSSEQTPVQPATHRTRGRSAVVAAALGLGLAGGAALVVDGLGETPPAAADSVDVRQGTNASGQTFGVADDLLAPPDLVLVVTNEGPEAYVHASAIFGTGPRTPEEAVRRAEQPLEERVLIAYESDGTTPAGTFTLNAGAQVEQTP